MRLNFKSGYIALKQFQIKQVTTRCTNLKKVLTFSDSQLIINCQLITKLVLFSNDTNKTFQAGFSVKNIINFQIKQSTVYLLKLKMQHVGQKCKNISTRKSFDVLSRYSMLISNNTSKTVKRIIFMYKFIKIIDKTQRNLFKFTSFIYHIAVKVALSRCRIFKSSWALPVER